MTSFHLHRFILPVLLTLHALLSRLSTVVSGWTPPNIYRRSVINSDRKYREILHLSIPFHFGNIDNFAGDASLVKSSSSSFMSKNSFDDFFEFDVPLGIEINYDIDDDDIDDDESFDDAFDRFLVSDENEDETDADDILFDPRTRNFRLVAAGSAGLSFDEIQLIFGAIKDVAEDFDVPFYPNNLFSESSNSGNDDDNVDETSGSFSEDGNNESPFVQIKDPIVTEEAQGILGRVLLLCLHDDNDIGYDVEENYSQDENYDGENENGDDCHVNKFVAQFHKRVSENIDGLAALLLPPLSIAENDGTSIEQEKFQLYQPPLVVIRSVMQRRKRSQQTWAPTKILAMEDELLEYFEGHIKLQNVEKSMVATKESSSDTNFRFTDAQSFKNNGKSLQHKQQGAVRGRSGIRQSQGRQNRGGGSRNNPERVERHDRESYNRSSRNEPGRGQGKGLGEGRGRRGGRGRGDRGGSTHIDPGGGIDRDRAVGRDHGAGRGRGIGKGRGEANQHSPGRGRS